MRPGRGTLVLVLGAVTLAGLGAQDLTPQATGRLESAYTWVPDAPAGAQTLAQVAGWAGLTAGTRDVKTELRASFSSSPAPALALARAWTKFRFPGVRLTTGLGRLAWGPGFVLVPGDLLFDSVGSNVDFGADELRSQGAWVGDVWVALGDEAYAEAAVLQNSLGARVSAAPAGVTLEASGAWDRSSHTLKAALSTQFHAGADWYATVRRDVPAGGPFTAGETFFGAGAFGVWTLAEGITLSSRHEALVPGTQGLPRLGWYDDLSLSPGEGWTITGRVLGDRAQDTWSPSAEVRWAPLQNLSLAVQGPLKAPWWVRTSVSARW